MSETIRGYSGNIVDCDPWGGLNPPRSIAATVTTVYACPTTGTTLVAANSVRCGLYMQNLSTQCLWFKYGVGGSSFVFTMQLAETGKPTSTFFMPSPIYSGAITGEWRSPGGTYVVITEF
jgi:hypothetical protein